MKLSRNSSVSGSRQSAMFQNKSSLNMTNDSIPFNQQFDYHLQDIAIIKSNKVKEPTGKIKLHIPDGKPIDVEFFKREPIEDLRSRIQTKIKENINNYYLVSNRGIIEDETTLDDYFISDGANILMIRKGIRHLKVKENREMWLKCAEIRKNGGSKMAIPPKFQTPFSKKKMDKSGTITKPSRGWSSLGTIPLKNE